MMARGGAVLGGAILAALAVACARAKPAGPVQVLDAWARPADSGATGGVYLVLKNTDTATLHITSFETPISTSTEAHETMLHGDMATMDIRTELVIAKGATLTMKPGGTHLMLMHLTRRLTRRDTVPVTLRFADGRVFVATAHVRTP